MINGYKFGQIIIDRVSYTNDVIILPDRVQENWRRQKGHLLQLVDIQESIKEANPKTVVIGTGKFGVMRIAEDIRGYMKKQEITLHAERTDEAVKIYNRLIEADNRIIAAFHITC